MCDSTIWESKQPCGYTNVAIKVVKHIEMPKAAL